ncbi:regulatory protein, luxR family [Methylomagnum ishizawai]|uniref:Regulatory protein, luxR family n=1 Tax=Methylomagnum ishizawai TaxID=1760988 RepID=A0A1Y6CVP4_9GAMM|nr:LuxR family transcriptional regulator [Methylomagnum ishizawai]SMF94407.1 regulatory protein, luxR family [Methylomagnum ishizawai]
MDSLPHALLAELIDPGPCTPREAEVVRLLCEGRPVKGIARRLGCTPKTVSTHLEHVRFKLGAHSPVQVALIAVAEGMVRVSRRAAGVLFALAMGWQALDNDALRPRAARHHRAGARVAQTWVRAGAGRAA